MGFLLGVATLLIIFILSSDMAAHYEVCETTKEGAKECARYGVIGFAFREIGVALNDYNGLITAIATIFIAWFTFSLRQSTEKLWDAGERQIELARETYAAQSTEMQASIGEAVRAATAMENVAQGIGMSAKAAQDSVATLRSRTAVQMRAYLTVLIARGIYQERERGLRFEARPILINSGHTPAHKVTYRAKAAVYPFPLPDSVTLEPPEDTFRAMLVLGPQQNIALNAMVETMFDDAIAEEIKRGRDKRLYIWGTVTYADAFGEAHETNLCHSLFWLRLENKELVSGNYTNRHNDAT